MGLLDRFRPSKNRMTELEAAIAHGTAQSMAGRQSGDEEQRRYMAENHAILFDSNLQSLLQGMSQITYTDPEGNLGEPGAEYTHTIPKYVAASIAASPLIRTGWVTEKEARLRNWETESLFIQLKMLLTEQETNKGGALVMDATKGIVIWNILGAINGRIAKIVKSRPSSVDVTVGPTPQGEKH